MEAHTTGAQIGDKQMANVVVEKFGVYYNEGARGANGGAAQNDKVWGIARIENTLVTFWGRRNGKLKFKTMPGQAGKLAAEAKWAEKTGARRDGGDIYMSIAKEQMRTFFSPSLIADLTTHFYSDMSLGKLNTRH